MKRFRRESPEFVTQKRGGQSFDLYGNGSSDRLYEEAEGFPTGTI